MKKRLFTFLTALSLLTALAVPALAIETVTLEDQGWRTYSGPYVDQFVSDYIAQHPEELAAFDADGYFEANYGGIMSKEGFMASNGIDEAGFRYRCWWESVNDKACRVYNAYVTECYEAEYPGELEGAMARILEAWGCATLEERAQQYGGDLKGDVEAVRQDMAAGYIENRQRAARDHDASLKYRAEYPGSWEEFDPDEGVDPAKKAEEMTRFFFQNEEEWKESKYAEYMYSAILSMEEAQRREGYLTRWPEEYAAFDPEGWYQSGVWGGYWTAEEYRESMGWDEETFKKGMFVQWVEKSACFDGDYCVMVDGVPIQFHDYRYRDLEGLTPCPKAENGRILVPLRATAEALGLTVEWKPETNEVTCFDGSAAVTFTLESTQYSGGSLDVAPYVEAGVTYLPLRALGEALGCKVTWLQDFSTAILEKK